MTQKEVFNLYVNNKMRTEEGYEIAREYYLTKASDSEKRIYESFLEIITNLLVKNYEKSAAHFKITFKKYGLPESEALRLVKERIENSKNNSPLEESNEDFLKELYEKCENARWKKEALEEIASNYKISYKLLLDLIAGYIKNFLKLSKNITNNLFRRIKASSLFNEFINNKKITDYYELLWYVKFHTNKEEKETFYKIASEIIASYCDKKTSREGIIASIARDYQIGIEEAEFFFQNWTLYNAKMSKENRIKEYYQELFLMLTSNQNIENIECFIENNELSIEEFLRKYLPVFLENIKNPEERQKQEKIILRKVNGELIRVRNSRRGYKARIKSVPAEENEILIAKRVITDLIHKNESNKDLIARIGEKNFSRYLTIVELNDPDLYNLYLVRTNHRKLNTTLIINLALWLTNGIEERGIKRAFTILDYYEYVGIPLNILPEILNDLQAREKAIIMRFVSVNSPGVNILPSPNKEVSKEEDREVKKHLITKNIPICESTYNLALLKYRQGLLYESNSLK